MVLDHKDTSNIRSSSLTLDAYTDSRSIAYAEQDIYGEKYVMSAVDFGGAATYIEPNKNLTEGMDFDIQFNSFRLNLSRIVSVESTINIHIYFRSFLKHLHILIFLQSIYSFFILLNISMLPFFSELFIHF